MTHDCARPTLLGTPADKFWSAGRQLDIAITVEISTCSALFSPVCGCLCASRTAVHNAKLKRGKLLTSSFGEWLASSCSTALRRSSTDFPRSPPRRHRQTLCEVADAGSATRVVPVVDDIHRVFRFSVRSVQGLSPNVGLYQQLETTTKTMSARNPGMKDKPTRPDSPLPGPFRHPLVQCPLPPPGRSWSHTGHGHPGCGPPLSPRREWFLLQSPSGKRTRGRRLFRRQSLGNM